MHVVIPRAETSWCPYPSVQDYLTLWARLWWCCSGLWVVQKLLSRSPCLPDPISCSGAQANPVPERFHLCGARCCWISILCMYEICFSSMLPVVRSRDSHWLHSWGQLSCSSCNFAKFCWILLNFAKFCFLLQPLSALGACMAFSSLGKDCSDSSAEVWDLLLLGNK